MDFRLGLKILPILPVLLLSACQSDHTEEAMQRARDYALQHTRMLSETARNHIRYVAPVLQTTVVFSHRPMRLSEYDHLNRNIDFNASADPKEDNIISQFVWTPPELGYSVIAIGHSQGDLSCWTPLKVILKNTDPYRINYEDALMQAVAYVTNNMLYLSTLERVRVRTSDAEIRETDFDLEYMFEEQLENADREWERFLTELRAQREKRQYSVIWKADDSKKRIVITGFGSDKGLEKWTPACGMVIPASQLDHYTLNIYRKGPDETDSPEKISQ